MALEHGFYEMVSALLSPGEKAKHQFTSAGGAEIPPGVSLAEAIAHPLTPPRAITLSLCPIFCIVSFFFLLLSRADYNRMRRE